MEQLYARSSYYDNIKGFLIISVVIGHFTDLALYNDNLLKSLFIFIYSFHMPLFIFINGLFSNNIIKSKKRLLSRIIFFLTLYILLKFIIFIIQYLNYGTAQFLLFTEAGTPWYLFATAGYYLITYFIKHINIRFLLSISIILALFAGYASDINDTFVLLRIIVFYPFFLLGYYSNHQTIERFMAQKHIRIIGFLFCIAFAFGCIILIEQVYGIRLLFTGRNSYSTLNNLYPFGALFRLLSYITSAVMCFSIMAIVSHKRLFLITHIGKNSLSIYFFHRPLLYILTYAGILDTMRAFFGNIAANLSWLLLALFISILLSNSHLTKVINFEHKLQP